MFRCYFSISTFVKYIILDNRPDILQNANVQVWSNRECQASYNQQKKTQTIQSTQMCAGKKDGGIDACWVSAIFYGSIEFYFVVFFPYSNIIPIYFAFRLIQGAP